MTHIERDTSDDHHARSRLGRSRLDDGQAEPCAGNRWLARHDGADLVLSLLGEWTIGKATVHIVDLPLNLSPVAALRFDSTHLGRRDSALLVFLSTLRETARRRGVVFDLTGLPPAACRLLSMLPAEAPVQREPARRVGLIGRVGLWTLRGWSEVVAITALVGEATLRSGPALRGKARTRAADVWSTVHDAGIGALPMVALVNILVGGIVAFVGSLQLRRFGAEIYVSNLIGVMEVREMAPLMTAILTFGGTHLFARSLRVPAQRGVNPEDAFEFPTIPSDIQNLKDELLHIDLPGIALKTQAVLAGMQCALEEIDHTIGPLSTSLQATLRDLAASASSLRNLTHDLERNPMGTLLRREHP